MTIAEMNRKEWKCYQMTHAGEGERGKNVLVTSAGTIQPGEAAYMAAERFNDDDQIHNGCRDSDYDGGEQTIEVVDERDNAVGRYIVL